MPENPRDLPPWIRHVRRPLKRAKFTNWPKWDFGLLKSSGLLGSVCVRVCVALGLVSLGGRSIREFPKIKEDLLTLATATVPAGSVIAPG